MRAYKRLVAKFLLSACACVAIATTSFSQAASPPLRDIRFSLDFIPLGRFAEFYVALAKGYYKDEGLNVTIISGKGTSDGIRLIETGVSDIGFVDIPSLAFTGAETSVQIVSVIYQKAPYCVFSLDPGANVTKPQDMVGLELGSSTASFVPRIHQAFMKMHGLDPSTLKVVNIDGAARVPMLLAGKVPAVDLYAMSMPGIVANAGGKQVKCLLLADFGLDLYGSGIGAKRDFIENNLSTVKGFVKASLRGLKDALTDPEEAAKLQRQYVKALDPKIIVEELKIVRDLAIVPDTRKNGIGWFDKERMKKTIDFMGSFVEAGHEKPNAERLYREDMLPQQPILP